MPEKRYEVGRLFLKLRGSVWYISWYDKRIRQTDGFSTGLTDFEAAKEAIHAYDIDTRKLTGTDAQLALVLQTYWVKYAQSIPSAGVQNAAQHDALRIWDDDPNISALTRDKQMKLVNALRAEGLSDWTIQGKLNRIWAAMNWCKRDNKDLVVPDIITAADWKPHFPNREKVYAIEELAALFNAAAAVPADLRMTRDNFTREHWWRYLVLNVATLSRVTALLELRKAQVNRQLGRIYLNPEGRRQTKKRRAIVPICPTLAAELDTWEYDDYLITYYGNPLGTTQFFDTLVETAGLWGSPNVIRHTMRTLLAERGVPDAEGDIVMGHEEEGSTTGARYKHRRPEYLQRVIEAIESVFDDLSQYVTRPFGGRTFVDQPLPENISSCVADAWHLTRRSESGGVRSA